MSSGLFLLQVSYLLQYGELPSKTELHRWDEALRRHSALPVFVENAVAALPHDAHFMGIVLTALNALSTSHPEQNPALAGQDIYKSKEIQDKQIVRLIGGTSELKLCERFSFWFPRMSTVTGNWTSIYSAQVIYVESSHCYSLRLIPHTIRTICHL